MDFDEKIAEFNEEGWFLLNCFQVAGMFRVNLMYKQPEGTGPYKHKASEFAEAATPSDALDAAWRNVKEREKHEAKQRKETPPVAASPSRGSVIPPRLQKRLEKALLDNFYAVKLDRRGA